MYNNSLQILVLTCVALVIILISLIYSEFLYIFNDCSETKKKHSNLFTDGRL